MAKYYLLPKGLVNRFQWVQTPIWLIEASAFYILLGFARIMPFRVVAAVFARLLGGFGYRNARKRRGVHRNISHVLPQAGKHAREAVVRQIFRSTGLAAAELFLLGTWRFRSTRRRRTSSPASRRSSLPRRMSVRGSFAT
jgi:lauroyl/myristoyl acyltransferase